jgi:hypothetical protein
MRLNATRLGSIASSRSFGNQLLDLAGQVSPLDLQFAVTKTLDPRVTFTRASTGTFVGANGAIQTAAVDAPRFDHNPTTGESLGLLVEEARTNLALPSENFDGWVKVLSTVTTDSINSPAGTQTADLITLSAGTGQKGVNQGGTTTGAVTYSVFLKAGTHSIVQLLQGGSTNNYANFNISTGVVGNTGTGTTASITAFGNGWYRCSMSHSNSVSGIYVNAAASLTDGFFPSVTVTGTFYAWGAQLEAVAFPTSYIPTTSATVTRAADVASVTGSNFSSWYNQTEGTVFAEASVLSSSYSTGVLWDVGAGGSFGSTEYIGWTGTGWQLSPDAAPINVASSVTATLPSRTATAIKLNDSIISASGLLGALDTSCTVPASASVLTIGKGGWSGAQNYVNGTIKRLTYWPKRLSDTTIQQITQ